MSQITIPQGDEEVVILSVQTEFPGFAFKKSIVRPLDIEYL